MEFQGKRILLCDCEHSMALDGGKLKKACAAAGSQGDADLNTQLCRSQLANFQAALGADKLLVACTQEAPLFSEVAAEEQSESEIAYFNIREAAGWSEQADEAYPKIAALIAEAAVERQPAPLVEYNSAGVCLVYGTDDRAIEIARQLSGRLETTVLIAGEAEVLAPRVMDVPVFRGRIREARGHMGSFALEIDDYAPARPSSKLALEFEPPRNNAFSQCDLILDLTGGTPLFQSHERRDGYLRPDPDDPAAVMKAAFDIGELVGEFEKPRYVRYQGDICAHARSGKTGCTRCLEVCPTGAITPAGDEVAIDPYICAGCGACASVCPTGAAAYDLPSGDSLYQRLRELFRAYEAAGGKNGVLLVHDERHGVEMISLMARSGRGLPARVIPFPVNEVTQIGIDFLATALGYGAAQIAILVGPEKQGELTGLAGQIGLVETVMAGLGYGGDRVQILDQQDPEAVEEALYALQTREGPPQGNFLPMGGKRTRTMLALRHLYERAPEKREILPLPQGAPFGSITVETGGCTLCLACVGACPTGALSDDPERPWLGFTEDACVQCGLCRGTCPESVITLEPRLNFTEQARELRELNRAEPFHCIRCGKPFGVAQSIQRVADQLAGKHSMFLQGEAVERIMMCEDCRVIVQFDSDAPLAGAPRPVTRTTEDYLRERELERSAQSPKGSNGSGGRTKKGDDDS